MKRAVATPDYRIDLRRWAALVALTHTAVEAPSATHLAALGERALTAERGWTALAPFPRGLVCRVLSRMAWAYASQSDAVLRARLAPLLLAAAGMVDELVQQEAPTSGAAPAGPEAGPGMGAVDQPAPRLPYRED